MPEVLTNTDQGSPIYPVKRSAQRKGLGNSRQVKARLGAAGEGLVVDLSENGIGLELAMPLQPGSTLAVDFDLPESGGHVRVDGRVIWASAGRRAGIRFERVPDLAGERLRKWVNLGWQTAKPVSPVAEASGPAPSAASPFESVDEPLTLDRAVGQVLARAMAITKATGAAIAIGPPEAMVCRASAGNAPDVGVPINPDSGLTGYCLRSRAAVRCDDTESDERVNAAACREMELRSALVIPVFSGKNADELSGILEVFSAQARAFTADHIAKLEKLTRILGVVAADLIPGAEASKADPASEAAQSAIPQSVIPKIDKPADASISPEPKEERAHLPRKIGDRSPAAESQTVPVAPPLGGRSGPSAAIGTSPALNRELPQGVGKVKPAALTAPVITTQIAAKETAVKLAELTKPTVANDVANNVANNVADNIAVTAEDTAVRTNSNSAVVDASAEVAILSAPSSVVEGPTSFDRMRIWLLAARSQSSRIGRVFRVLGVIVIVLEIAAAIYLFTRWEKKRAALASSSHAVQAVSVPVTPAAFSQPAVVPPPLPAAPAAKHKKLSQAGLSPEDGSDDVIVVNREAGASPSASPSVPGTRVGSSKGSVTTDAEPPAPAPIAGQTDLAAIHLPDNPAKPSLAVRLSSGTTGGKLIKRIEPTYPEAAKSRRVQGQVVLTAHVATDGSVKSIHTVKGNPFLASAAVDAVKHWHYEPMKLNGNPVEMDTTITVQFKLPN